MTVQRIGGIYEFDAEDTTTLLGEGGMGKVFEGRNTQTDEPVAIKELRAEIVRENPAQVERFIREADALRRLNHPNIVAVQESINTNDNHYIVMDYVKGGSLLDLLKQNPRLPIERVLEISLDLADALTRAHRLNIIHRDIKPANVLLAEDGTPRLTDFGVARIEDKTNMTQTGTVVGTLHYLSPEALNGERPSESTDIWAFGVMLYEMLAGRRPFADESTGSLINSIMNKEPLSLTELREEIPLGLRNLIERMLIKDPSQRIDSVRKVGTELENIIRGTDSDELNIGADVREALVAQAAAGHFDQSTTDDEQIAPLSTPSGGGTIVLENRHGFTRVRDEQGQEYISIPVEVARRKRRNGIILVVLGLFVAIFIVVLLPNLDDNENTSLQAPIVDPVADGEYMVLVTRFLDLTTDQEMTGEERGLLVSELRQFFERDIPFSNIVIREYDGFISNEADARELAISVGAPIIIWGGRADQGASLFIQVGALDDFSYNQFDRDLLERLLNVETAIVDPAQRAITPYILGMLGTLHAADGNVFEFMRNLAILEQEQDPPAQLTSSGVNEGLYVYFQNYLTDPTAAIEAIDESLTIDGGNAILYAMRALSQARQGEFDAVRRDADTAMRIGPDNWTTAAILSLMSSDDFDVVIDNAIALTEMRPDDWFFHYLVGENLYNFDRRNEAKQYLDQSIALNPQANYPYIASYLLAIRQGRVQDAASYIHTVVEEFPDPNFGSRVLNATFGDNIDAANVLNSGIGNLLIGQYTVVLNQTDQLIASLSEDRLETQTLLDDLPPNGQDVNLVTDLLMVRALAQCAVGDYDASQSTILMALQIDPDYHLLHLLISENYFDQGDLEATENALEQARGLSEEFDQLVEAAVNDELTCDNFLIYFDDLYEQNES